MADIAVAAPADRKAPPKFKQRTVRTFKSKAPKPGQKGWGGFKTSQAKYRNLFFILPRKTHVLVCLSLYSSDFFCLLHSDSETTSLAWRVLAQTSQWFAHGKPLVIWSSTTSLNMELFNLPLHPYCYYSPSYIPTVG